MIKKQDFKHLIDFLQSRLKEPLPGKIAHRRMIPEIRIPEFELIPENYRESSVLLLLFENNSEVRTILIKRPEYKGVHSGQIAFPGGSREDIDQTLADTALREAQEEVGISAERVRIIGTLSTIYIPPSGFMVHPFVAWTETLPAFTPDPSEVKEIFEVSAFHFSGDSQIRHKFIKLHRGIEFETPYFAYNDETIWGATAMILSEFGCLLEEFKNKSIQSV